MQWWYTGFIAIRTYPRCIQCVYIQLQLIRAVLYSKIEKIKKRKHNENVPAVAGRHRAPALSTIDTTIPIGLSHEIDRCPLREAYRRPNPRMIWVSIGRNMGHSH
jgi:hypothetical protein